jgi:[acyl-carrier-protein] S-malonyltransferase
VVTVVLCPGQGAQRVGMGRDLAARFPAAKDTFGSIDEALGTSLSRLMWEGPEDELTLTHNAQPAILAHSAAVLAVVRDRLGTPGAGAGHSLGEYSAHVAARTLSETDAAQLVRRRGELMLAAGRQRPGTMAAVLGLATAEVQAACDEASGPDGLAVPANLNAPDQTVISGDPTGVNRAGEGCKARGAKRVIPLNVSGAFHSPFPVIANASGEAVRTGVDAKRLLADQLTAPVRWVVCMQAAAQLCPDATFVEIGPGNVLSGLLKRIVPGAKAITLGTADEVERFLVRVTTG